ncbi:MAG: ABC transporter permease, partial [Gemmatimonadota bacterium]|nr:ABC transporter permease [Gemmatimonadota bacterium]
LGIALAPMALRVLCAMLPTSLAGVTTAQLDLRVLTFATGLALVTATAFGLWPAVGATRGDANEAIKTGGGHGATAGKTTGRARRTLVAAELALAVMLLVGAVLMLRSFARLMSEDAGLDPERVATLEMSFPHSAGSWTRVRTINAVLERLSGQPGIQAVGAVNDLPLRGGGGIAVNVEVEGAAAPRSPGEMRFARALFASGGYFEALGVALLRGRTFTSADDSLAPPVAIVNKAMATTYLPGLDPIGRVFRLPRDSVPITIVGVVADVREAGLDRDPPPQVFFPIDAQPPSNVALVARGTLPPRALLARLVEAVRSADPAQPVFNVRMMDEVVGASVAARRTNTILIVTFAGLALILAALGVYSVVAYGVAQRTREFGIRAAFGATGQDIVGLVSREMLVVVAIGTVSGLVAAWALTRVLATLLYGVEPRDAATFAIVPLLMLPPAVLAILLPAFRATRVSPSEVMRGD